MPHLFLREDVLALMATAQAKGSGSQQLQYYELLALNDGDEKVASMPSMAVLIALKTTC